MRDSLFRTFAKVENRRRESWVLDAMSAMNHPLRGPAALAFDAGITPISLSAILAYSAVHLVASLAIGVLVCRLVFEAELQPAQAQTALLFIVAGFAGTIAMVGIVSAPIREVLPWWSIMSANALAVLVAGSVMIRRHPEFLSRMTETVR